MKSVLTSFLKELDLLARVGEPQAIHFILSVLVDEILGRVFQSPTKYHEERNSLRF